MRIDPLARADALLGRAIESGVERHHRRRLTALGQVHAVDPRGPQLWAAGDPPPRPGNRLDVLIDGAAALPAIAEAIAGARSHVHITGWHLASHFELVRGERPAEMNVVTDDARLARETRERLWAEHLELELDDVRGRDPRALVDEHWIPVAREQLRRERAGEEPTHRLVALPGVSRRSGRLIGPLTGIVDDS